MGMGKTTAPAVGMSEGRFVSSLIPSRHRGAPGEVEPAERAGPAPSQARCLRCRVRGESGETLVLLPFPCLGHGLLSMPSHVPGPGEEATGMLSHLGSFCGPMAVGLMLSHHPTHRHRSSSSWPRTCPLIPFWSPSARAAHAPTSAGHSWRNCRSCYRRTRWAGTLRAPWGTQVPWLVWHQPAFPHCAVE